MSNSADAGQQLASAPQHGATRRRRAFNQFDLNLVQTFLAIWELGSLTATGDRLGLSQPAVSHALRKLREQFDDPLFVRVGNRMQATAAAARLHEPFEQALRSLRAAVEGSGVFVPQESARTFRLAMTDLGGYLFLDDIVAAIAQSGPDLRVEVTDPPTGDIENRLRSGNLDLALGYVPSLSESCASRPLLYDSFVVLVRRDHPFTGDLLSVDDFLGLTFIDATTEAPGYYEVERQLAQLSAQRKVIARLKHHSAAPEIIRKTDMAAIYPTSISRKLNVEGQFRLIRLPFEVPTLVIGLHTHRQFAPDQGINWLATLIADIAQRRFGAPVQPYDQRIREP